MASSPLEMATLAASGPPQMSYQPDVYDPNAEDSDEEECCDDMEDDMAMWSSHRVVQRSAPIAIPGSRRRGEVRMAASERMGAPPTMMSMLVHEGAARTTDGRGNWSTRSMLDLMRTSPFAPMTSGDEIVPGKPETGDSRKLKMAYFDEGALW